MIVTVASNFCLNYFPANSWNAFSNRLPYTLDFRSVQYECALLEIIFHSNKEQAMAPPPFIDQFINVESTILNPQPYGSSTRQLLRIVQTGSTKSQQLQLIAPRYHLVRQERFDILDISLATELFSVPDVTRVAASRIATAEVYTVVTPHTTHRLVARAFHTLVSRRTKTHPGNLSSSSSSASTFFIIVITFTHHS